MNYIALIDCNNFFVSCERLFRPDLHNRPVAVLSSNDGCVVARSQEVKDMGIPMGIPYFKIKDICDIHEITFFSSNFSLYRDISKRVMHALSEEVDTYQAYSIDEAFFELPHTISDRELHTLRTNIMQKTGIPVSIGVARTKTLAKIAGGRAKNGSGVFVLTDHAWSTIQESIRCGSVWGVGKETTEKLRTSGIHTVKDFLSVDQGYIQDNFGVSGKRMHLELRGIPVSTVGSGDDAKHKSLMSTRSFHKTTKSRSNMESALGRHVVQLSEKLRVNKWLTSHVRIIAAPSAYGDYALRKGSANAVLQEPTADTQKLLKVALDLFNTVYDPTVPYKKAGVVFGQIIPVEYAHRSMFDETDTYEDTLSNVTDGINARFGNGTLRPGVVLGEGEWESSSRFRSQGYTTKWSEIASVKAK